LEKTMDRWLVVSPENEIKTSCITAEYLRQANR
jgi:hypothetical protein